VNRTQSRDETGALGGRLLSDIFDALSPDERDLLPDPVRRLLE
jgi:hypothetical protein